MKKTKAKWKSPQNRDVVSRLIEALPRAFDFYGLGQVELQNQVKDDFWSDQAHALAFAFRGDINAWLVIRVEFAQDITLYKELGNILAARMANSLADLHGLDVMISPPITLKPKSLARLASNYRNRPEGSPLHQWIGRKTYFFKEEKTIPVEAWILASTVMGEKGHDETAELDAPDFDTLSDGPVENDQEADADEDSGPAGGYGHA